MTHTIKLHRVISAPPERVYRAFLTPDALVKWLPPNGFTAHVNQMDATVGGRFHMHFTNFSTQDKIAFGGEYLALVPNELIKYTDIFDDPNLAGVITVTVTLTSVACGTEVSIVQEGVPEMIPIDGCYLGWQESLTALATLVQPNISN